MQTLFEDLKSLKKIIKPDIRWKEKTRQEIVSLCQKTTYKSEKRSLSLSFYRRSFVFRLAPVLACLILLIIVPSTVIASKSSRPGQLLYPVKRLVEQGQIAIARNEKQNELIGKFSEERALELEQAIQIDTEKIQLMAAFELKSSTEKVMRLTKLKGKPKIIKKLKKRLVRIKSKVTSPKVLQFINQALLMLEENQNTFQTPKKQQDKSPIKIISPLVGSSTPTFPTATPTVAWDPDNAKSQDESNSNQSAPLEPTVAIVTPVPTMSETLIKEKSGNIRLRQLIKRIIQKSVVLN